MQDSAHDSDDDQHRELPPRIPSQVGMDPVPPPEPPLPEHRRSHAPQTWADRRGRFLHARFSDVSSDFRKSHGDQFQRQFQNLARSVRAFRRPQRMMANVGGSSRRTMRYEDDEQDSGDTQQQQQQQQAQQVNRPDFEDEESESDYPPLSLLGQIIDCIQLMRYRVGLLVNDKDVQLLVVLLIGVNAIMMGVGTYDFVNKNPAVDHAFEQMDQTFLIIFTIELGMQFIFYGLRLLTDGWLVFDLIIITLSWAFAQVQIIRAFRIFRAFRLITRIKVMKNLVLALFSVVPRMFAIGILLLLVSYIYAVMCTQLFKDLYDRQLTDEDYFGRMDRTFFTLFQLMTLDSWTDVAREVMAVYSWAWMPIGSYVIITGFVVVNLIIAVICDAISALHEDDKARLHGTYEEEDEKESESGESGSFAECSSDEDGTSASDSQTIKPDDIRKQLDVLEDHVMELMRMQEESFQTLAHLTQQLQSQRLLIVANSPMSPSTTTASGEKNPPEMQGGLSSASSDDDSGLF